MLIRGLSYKWNKQAKNFDTNKNATKNINQLSAIYKRSYSQRSSTAQKKFCVQAATSSKSLDTTGGSILQDRHFWKKEKNFCPTSTIFNPSLLIYHWNHYLATNFKRKPRESIPQLLRRIVKLVMTLSRVSLAIRKYAVSKTDSRALTDIHSFLRRGKDEKEIKIEKLKGLLFDKTSYSVENNHKFPYWARNLCSYPPEFREKSLLLKMQRYLRGIHNFSRFTKEAQMEICRHVIYSRYDKLRVILSQVSDIEELNIATYPLVFKVIFTWPEFNIATYSLVFKVIFTWPEFNFATYSLVFRVIFTWPEFNFATYSLVFKVIFTWSEFIIATYSLVFKVIFTWPSMFVAYVIFFNKLP